MNRDDPVAGWDLERSTIASIVRGQLHAIGDQLHLVAGNEGDGIDAIDLLAVPNRACDAA
jgi:hypothetical protein